MIVDSVAAVSRNLARTRFRKMSTALFRYYPAKRGVATIDDFDGDLRMSLDRSSYISSAIYWRGHHSVSIVQFLRKFLRSEMTFVDVGANIGEITLVAAKRLSHGRVLAFEPMPATFAQLSHNIALNGLARVSLFNCGLYDQPGELPIYTKKDNPCGTVNRGVPSLFSTGADVESAVVPLRTFDDVAAESALERLDAMKIDVEGAEWMVLRGAISSLERFRPVVIVEISEANFRRAGYTVEDFLSFVRSLGYDLKSLHEPDGTIGPECDAVAFPQETKSAVVDILRSIARR